MMFLYNQVKSQKSLFEVTYGIIINVWYRPLCRPNQVNERLGVLHHEVWAF